MSPEDLEVRVWEKIWSAALLVIIDEWSLTTMLSRFLALLLSIHVMVSLDALQSGEHNAPNIPMIIPCWI